MRAVSYQLAAGSGGRRGCGAAELQFLPAPKQQHHLRDFRLQQQGSGSGWALSLSAGALRFFLCAGQPGRSSRAAADLALQQVVMHQLQPGFSQLQGCCASSEGCSGLADVHGRHCGAAQQQ